MNRGIAWAAGWGGLVLILLFSAGWKMMVPTEQPDTQLARPSEPDQVEGLLIDETLWLRDSRGGLQGIALGQGTSLRYFAAGVRDIVLFDGTLWILRVRAGDARRFSVEVWRRGEFIPIYDGSFERQDAPYVLTPIHERLAVIGPRKADVIAADGSKDAPIIFSEPTLVPFSASAVVTSDGNSLYIGRNSGEWGGGLVSVDIASGTVSTIDRRDSDDLCAGPLNSDCDPVTDLIPDPRNRHCVIASVGLQHLGGASGRILRVCGSKVDVLYQQPFDRHAIVPGTEPFYHLATQNGGFWAASPEGLYFFEKGSFRKHSYPTSSVVAGIGLSQKVPGVILVDERPDWRADGNGDAPLIVTTK